MFWRNSGSNTFIEQALFGGGEDGLGDAALCERIRDGERIGSERVVAPALRVAIDEFDGEIGEGFTVEVEAEALVVIADREAEELVVAVNIEGAEVTFIEHGTHDADAEIGVVEEGAVPVPDDVVVAH